MTVFLICLTTAFVSAVVSAVATFLIVDGRYQRLLREEIEVLEDGFNRISLDLERR